MEHVPMKLTYCLGSAYPRNFFTNEQSRFPSPAANMMPQRVEAPVSGEVLKNTSEKV
jgi:hypothetical protein